MRVLCYKYHSNYQNWALKPHFGVLGPVGLVCNCPPAFTFLAYLAWRRAESFGEGQVSMSGVPVSGLGLLG